MAIYMYNKKKDFLTLSMNYKLFKKSIGSALYV